MLAALHETAQASPELYIYGPLGMGCLVFAGVIVVLWRTLQKKSEQHRDHVSTLTKEHRAQLEQLTNRHVDKAEQWSASHAKLAQDLKQLLEAIAARSQQ